MPRRTACLALLLFACSSPSTHNPGGGDDDGTGTDAGAGSDAGPPGPASAKAKKVVVGNGYTLALTTTGQVRAWGFKDHIGIANQTENVLIPAVIPGLESGVLDITTSYNTSCAVRGDGTVVCWGVNDLGEVGDGSMEDRATPTPVMGLTGAVSVSIGTNTACAVTTGGAVKCWGDNTNRKLNVMTPDPTNSNAYDPSPVPLDTLPSGIKSVQVGDQHVCALTTTNTLKCWGDNLFGQCGNGDLEITTLPQAFGDALGNVVTLSNVVDYAPSYRSTVAVLSTGAVKSWGTEEGGALGNNVDMTFNDQPTPLDVTGLSSGGTAVSTSCAVVSGAVRCWESNPGDGTDDEPLTARTVTGITDAVQVSAGSHSCAVTATGAVKCWGYNDNGELGKGTQGNDSTNEAKFLAPVAVLGFP
jgi:alpha-tubulin suppressor-like RCC1 family protein